MADETDREGVRLRAAQRSRHGVEGLSDAQHRYLSGGLSQPGGRLPLFYDDGQKVEAQTIRACVQSGYCEPWFANPMKPDWLVCRLTERGRALFR